MGQLKRQSEQEDGGGRTIIWQLAWWLFGTWADSFRKTLKVSRELEKHGAQGFLAAKVTGSSASAISILKSSRQRELYHCFETGGLSWEQ